MKSTWKKPLLVFSLIFLFSIFYFSIVSAQSASDLQSNIDAKSAQIESLQKEIDQYNAQVTAIGAQAKTLQNNLKTLDLTAKKLSASITLTENKIAKVTLTITQLAGGISTTTDQISLDQNSMRETLLQMYQDESES